MNNSTFFKTLLAAVAFILVSSGAKAQVIKTDTIRESRLSNLATALGNSDELIVADDAELNARNWFVSLGFGVNTINAEGNNKVNNMFDRRRGKIQISAGRWFNNYFGLRGQIGIGKVSAYYLAGAIYGKQLNSFDYPEGTMQYVIEKDGLAWFRRKFTYMDFNIAAMTDVVKWFDKDSRWGVQLYAGPVLTYSFKKQGFHNNTTLGLKAGTQIDYKISKRWSIMGDLQANFLNESFDGIVGGEKEGDNKTLDFLAAASIGLSYHFGGAPATTNVEIPVVYENTYIPQPKRVKEVKAPAKNIIAPFVVRFFIDKSYIEKGQKPQINKFAEYLKNNKNAKVMLTGYADKETAYPEYNMRLSQKRVNSVKKYLIEECGIAEERIETNAKGDTERVYDEDFRWNRVVVMTIVEE